MNHSIGKCGKRPPSSTLEPNPVVQITTPSREQDYALNIVVVFQDSAARDWAAQICQKAAQVAGLESVHSDWWELKSLGDSKTLATASLAATQADILVVSIRDAVDVPAELSAWVSSWLPHRCATAGALIAMICLRDLPGGSPDNLQGYLREIARIGGLDFLLRERPLPPGSRGFYRMETSGDKLPASTSVMAEVVSWDHLGRDQNPRG